MYSKRHLPDIEQWSQSSGSDVIPRRDRPGLAGLRPHTVSVEADAEVGESSLLTTYWSGFPGSLTSTFLGRRGAASVEADAEVGEGVLVEREFFIDNLLVRR